VAKTFWPAEGEGMQLMIAVVEYLHRDYDYRGSIHSQGLSQYTDDTYTQQDINKIN
jgi:hypothetical protein